MWDGFACTRGKDFYHFFFFFYYSYDVKRPGLRAEMLVVHEYTLLNDSPELVLLVFIVKRQESLRLSQMTNE